MLNTENRETNKIPTMLTIRELAKETKPYGVTEFFIRHAVVDGRVPHVKAGRKILINREKFIAFLNGETR